MKMFKTIIGGICVGVANIIPGVSGGTIMVILGLFDRLIASVSGVFKVHNPDRKKDILFLSQVMLGAAIGLIGFAKIIDWLFGNIPTQTLFWFVGLIALSIPSLVKQELRDHKIAWFPMAVGMALIFIIVFFNPGEQEMQITVFPALSLGMLIKFIVIGAIAGGTMLLPGVSGSMVLLIIGDYYLFKSYVANVTTFKWDILIPLGFIGIGVLLGIVISAKLTKYFLDRRRRGTVSFILGLVLASAMVLIPLDANYTPMVIVTSMLAFVFGAAVIILVEKHA